MTVLDRVRELNQKLAALLEDPQVGLISWCGFYMSILDELASLRSHHPMVPMSEVK